MHKLFYIGLVGIALFEFLNVYFIMPMPGSQEMNSLDVAYFLHSYRWLFRIFFIASILYGARFVLQRKRKWIPIVSFAIAVIPVYMFNFKMKADKMFLQTNNLSFKSKTENKIPGDRLVLGITNEDQAKAYPLTFIVYHHQIRDEIAGKNIMITYCNVCRTGRAFEPVVNEQVETFRLVGMDHYNAMFEDSRTKSWWRQVTGEAVAGKLEGKQLPEIISHQMTLDKWFELYPESLVLQEDPEFNTKYDSLARFERGKSKSNLTRTDNLSWKDKSWVIGITVGNENKAYDWNELQKMRIINDQIANHQIVIALSRDDHSFVAFEKDTNTNFSITENDILISGNTQYDFKGCKVNSSNDCLKPIQAYQEFWHSWLTFHPDTKKGIRD